MLEGRHYQNAYVTRNRDKWLERFPRIATADTILTHEGTTPVMTPEGPGEQTCRLAFIWIGGLQYELIEPVGGDVGIYADALPEGDALQFHHICMRVPDWTDFRARVDTQRYPIVLEGGSDHLRFLYLDMRETLGHYCEYCWMHEAMWTRMGGPAMPA
ncbi:VOC family protein [Stakelama tenebrarum]|uniref:VOC domain-containing protein n=1 Tax=Stakelama tenebrarum TaxID=2711215 RepID=A0A6G6Y1Q7_9SPHN|nr:VOC family protein [Sphingosinithalassobacter tenebrarum]QIG78840.1 hypothetical protein G5C33_02890 [Sphingosinithalassobacter tenebrarum]